MGKGIEGIIEKWRTKIQETENRLVAQNPNADLKYEGGFYYSIDEEDGFMERLGWKDVDVSKEPLIQLLGPWTNDRECFPVEFVREMMKEARRLKEP